ncbi:multidrug resistance-associated protein 4, partial [Biomphalaria glabrata]
ETKHITANGVPAKLFKSQNSTLDSPTNLDTSYDISDLTYEITDIENSLKMIDDVSDAPEVGARAKKADAVSTNSSSVTPLTATSASDTEQTALLTPTSPEEEASLAETKAMLKTEPHDRTSDDENDEGDESLVLI